ALAAVEQASRLGGGEGLDPEVVQHLPEDAPGVLVELATERPGAAIEDEDSDTELRDVVRGLEAEQPRAHDDRGLASTRADVLLDLHGIVDRPEREAPRYTQVFDLWDGCAG